MPKKILPSRKFSQISVFNKVEKYIIKSEKEVIDHILEEKMLLTPEQQDQFYQIIIDQFRAGGLGVHGVGGRWEKEKG